MNFKVKILALAIFFVLFQSCTKSEKKGQSCSDPSAINYGKSGSCTYPKDEVLGSYSIGVTSYPLQPMQVGDSFQLEVRTATCYGVTGNSNVELLFEQSSFNPYDFCISLNGYNFSFTDSFYVSWALAQVTGNGSFQGNAFQFTGTVHISSGDYPIVLMGRKTN